MRSLIIALALVAACTTATSSAGTPVDAPAPAPADPQPAPVTSAAARDTGAWVDSVMATLSPRQRIAQMVMFWVLGDFNSVDDSVFKEVVRWVEQEGVGGMTMSLGTPIEVAAKINYLQRRARVPLLVSSDLEPSLMRLEAAIFPHYLLETGGATAFPTAMALAATGREDDVYQVARAIAREARAVGIHVNFAPTVDVNINPDNPVIGTRSFGEDPQRVAQLSAAFVRGTRDGGLLATAKHFPGHGDTDVDSHVGLPVVTANPARLSAVELVPFRASIAAGAELVMSAHIALPAIGGDSATPATLRHDVMTGLLRDSLGFRGLTITDALTMEGVGKGYSIEESVVQAVKAGSDILLRPGDDATRAIDGVLAAVQSGGLTQARIDESVRRILLHKARAGLATERFVSLEALRSTVSSREHRTLAQDVAQRAVTLVRDSARAVPLRAGRVALVHYMPETELKAGRAFAREMARLRPGTRLAARLSPATAPSTLDSIGAQLRAADAVVIATYVRRVEGEGRTTVPPHVARWIDSVATDPRVVVVGFGNPYVIRQFPRARAYLNTYGIGDALENAVARALTGNAPIGGKSPVSLPGFFRAGEGLQR
ncbi:MAG TPA: glycoside hydrolase family 3 N-terminal domain-containing protein [Gemmatimonadaceae bacterium]|nr:glycoside hydrolase family 3 N-terminal domain-containing protein [Gemmatimonadaceae bacterium]